MDENYRQKMKSSRPSRVIAATLALVSMLFMQIVLAGYVCPKPAMDSSVPGMSAMSATAVDMPGCEQMDVVQPSLCHASVHAVHQSLDKHESPSVQPFVPASISLILVHAIPRVPSGQFAFNTTRQSGAAPPALAIRNCCFRI